ncbi:MAG: 2-dehydropantoate 2-reductase [Labilithrix sp.]|nr:2-dehydropantoate 2-reductase [Labilithrix sp.]
MSDSAAPRFLVMGCGAIGGIVAGCLAETGQDVTVVTTNEAIHEAVQARGLKLVGEGAPRVVPLSSSFRASLGVPTDDGRFDYVILATQPPQVEEAAAQAAPVLAAGGAMVCLQNGLCEERVAKIVGDDRVIGGVVAWGATMPEPGMYERTAAGGFTLGRIGSGERSLLGTSHDGLVGALEAVGPVETTDNLRGKRWSKLAINCAISSLGTIGGDRLGVLMQHRTVRRLGLEIMTEVVQVARKESVRLEKVSGTLDLNWIALDEIERKVSGSPSLVAKHGLLLAVGFRYRRMKSSMLSAIERGRTPAVDFLNGEVVDRARLHQMPVPTNEAVRRIVWEIASGEQKPGMDAIRTLYERTAPHGA